jgi:ubiquinone/menaquinone biosynthesis C-methylase UbiE
MSVDQQVRKHFHADAQRFDAIYDEEKGPVARFIDNVWRGVVRRRLDLTLEALAPLEGKSVLDVGCGSGRFCLAYAQHGAAKVLGIDFAPAMIDLAKEYARRLEVTHRCEFRVGSFPEAITEADRSFDAATGLGFFDYIERPVPIIARMRELSRETLVLSFPKAHEFRVPLRRLRFKVIGCPLFLYTEPQVKKILADAGVTRYDWKNLDRDYLVVAHLG